MAPRGNGLAGLSVWTWPSLSVARTVRVCRSRPAWGCPPDVPLAPVVDAGFGPQGRRQPLAVVDADLHGLDAAALGPGDAPDGHARTRPHGRESLRGVDTGLRQHRCVGGPAPLGPVRRVLGVRRRRELGKPLGAADEPVQAGRDQTGREAVPGGERLAVHRHRHEGVAVVGERLDGSGDGEARRGRAEDLVDAGTDARTLEQVADAHPKPAGGADVAAAHLVADAREGDVPLDHGQVQQLGIGEAEGGVDVTVDLQAPAARVHARDDERGVDAVERAVGRPERAEPSYPRLEPRRQWAQAHLGCRQVGGAGHGRVGGELLPEGTGDGCARCHTGGAEEEGSPRWRAGGHRLRGRPLEWCPRTGALPGNQGQQAGQGREAHGGRSEAGQDVE